MRDKLQRLETLGVGAAYFISFVLLGTMIMLNLFIGVIINSMDEAQAEQEEHDRKRHIARDGHPSMGDEIRQVEEELEKLSRRLSQLRQRSQQR